MRQSRHSSSKRTKLLAACYLLLSTAAAVAAFRRCYCCYSSPPLLLLSAAATAILSSHCCCCSLSPLLLLYAVAAAAALCRCCCCSLPRLLLLSAAAATALCRGCCCSLPRLLLLSVAMLLLSAAAALQRRYCCYCSPRLLLSVAAAGAVRYGCCCLAYFLVDLCHYGLAVPEDHLFIAHHLSTTTYIASCRYYTHHGRTSLMSLLAAGEITTPLQAVWTLARLARDGGSQLADMIYVKLSPVYTLFFTAVRVVLGHLLLHELARYYHTLDHPAIPRWLACFWMLEVALAIAGSFVWVYKLWRRLLKMYSSRVPSRQE